MGVDELGRPDDGRFSADTAAPPSKRVVLSPRRGVAVLVLLGEHDVETAKDLERQLLDLVNETELVVIDCSYATFVDSSFVHNVIRAYKHARQLGRRLVLQSGGNSKVLRALEITGALLFV